MQRLKTHSQFQAVLAGQRIASTAHFMLHARGLADIGWRPASQAAQSAGTPTAPPDMLHASAMGAMVPKRWAKRAVTRNMIKRQIYSVGSAAALPHFAYVVRLRAGFDRKQFVSAASDRLKRQVRQELLVLFGNAHPGRASGSPAVAAQT